MEPSWLGSNSSAATYYLPPSVVSFQIIKIECLAQSECLKTVAVSLPLPTTFSFCFIFRIVNVSVTSLGWRIMTEDLSEEPLS